MKRQSKAPLLVCLFLAVITFVPGCGADRSAVSPEGSSLTSEVEELPTPRSTSYVPDVCNLEDFTPPDWSCVPEPPENCYYSVDAECYEAAKDAYQSAMLAACQELVEEYWIIKDLVNQATDECYQAQSDCNERTGGTNEQCHAQWHECIDLVNQFWDDGLGAALDAQDQKEQEAADQFQEAMQNCCQLTCQEPPGGH